MRKGLGLVLFPLFWVGASSWITDAPRGLAVFLGTSAAAVLLVLLYWRFEKRRHPGDLPRMQARAKEMDKEVELRRRSARS